MNDFIPEDIIKKVRAEFKEDDSIFTLQLLADLRRESPKLFGDRILRCIVALAQGRVSELGKAIDLARLDWRDLIVAAEYDGWSNQVRHLSLPFGNHPEAAIVKEWFVGREVVVPLDVGVEIKWIVERSDIREFSLARIDLVSKVNPKVTDPSLYFVVTRFLCIRGEKPISESNAFEGKAIFRYAVLSENNFAFRGFECYAQHITKRGIWCKPQRPDN